MGEKKLRQYLTMQELQDEIIPWSESTIKRRIKDSNFPVWNDGGKLLFPTKEVTEWIKARPQIKKS